MVGWCSMGTFNDPCKLAIFLGGTATFPIRWRHVQLPRLRATRQGRRHGEGQCGGHRSPRGAWEPIRDGIWMGNASSFWHFFWKILFGKACLKPTWPRRCADLIWCYLIFAWQRYGQSMSVLVLLRWSRDAGPDRLRAQQVIERWDAGQTPQSFWPHRFDPAAGVVVWYPNQFKQVEYIYI